MTAKQYCLILSTLLFWVAPFFGSVLLGIMAIAGWAAFAPAGGGHFECRLAGAGHLSGQVGMGGGRNWVHCAAGDVASPQQKGWMAGIVFRSLILSVTKVLRKYRKELEKEEKPLHRAGELVEAELKMKGILLNDDGDCLMVYREGQ